jgi:hypothetical protein
MLDDALTLAHGHARELDFAWELEQLPALLERGGGAGRQRAAFEIAGMDGLLRELTKLTGESAAAPNAPSC